MRQGYYATASWTDSNIGKLIDAFEAHFDWDRAVVAFWGDHGEAGPETNRPYLMTPASASLPFAPLAPPFGLPSSQDTTSAITTNGRK